MQDWYYETRRLIRHIGHHLNKRQKHIVIKDFVITEFYALSVSSNSRDLILTNNRTCLILADIRRILILLKTMVEVPKTTYLIEKCSFFVIEMKNDEPF